jgi:hypothetical protein
MLMEEPMVITTQQDQIVQIGSPTLGPVLAMMRLDEMSLGTSRPDATTMPKPELMT